MNPVDHVSVLESAGRRCGADIAFYSLTVVVTTSISVRPRPSPATPHRVKRPVLLLPGEPVCSVVRRRRRSRFTGDAWVRVFFAAGSGFLGANSTHYVPGNKKHGACELSTAIFQSRRRVRGVVRGVLGAEPRSFIKSSRGRSSSLIKMNAFDMTSKNRRS